jgi:hypothetical protein
MLTLTGRSIPAYFLETHASSCQPSEAPSSTPIVEDAAATARKRLAPDSSCKSNGSAAQTVAAIARPATSPPAAADAQQQGRAAEGGGGQSATEAGHLHDVDLQHDSRERQEPDSFDLTCDDEGWLLDGATQAASTQYAPTQAGSTQAGSRAPASSGKNVFSVLMQVIDPTRAVCIQ